MAVMRQHKGALHRSAPFALWYLLLLLPLGVAQPAVADCPAGRIDAEVAVSYVYDGDTVKLRDGSKLRFIGINTPEIDHDGGRSEPYAQAARERVQQLLGDARLRIRFGDERRDRYGRLLGHPYLPDGRSLNVLLLQEGLASTLVVPPNTWNHQCYQSAERRARTRGTGIWSLDRYRAVSPSGLGKRGDGYRLVEAVVEKVLESRNSVWLELDGPMALRIPRKDLPYFAGLDLEAMAGRRILARGWPHYHKGKWRMTVRHPAALEFP
jgi:endonuclease YncB( thermonuclease family)